MLSLVSYEYNSTETLLEVVKASVDCMKLVPDDGTRREFGRYVRQRCINPDHVDENPTLLLYVDGCFCPSCALTLDAVGIYKLYHPEVTFVEAVRQLAANPDVKLSGEPAQGKPTRELDPDLAVKYHLALAQRPDQLEALEAYGISRAAVKKFKLGLAVIGVRLEDDTFEQQVRWSVPVYAGGKLKQVIYRKNDDTQRGGKVTMETGAGSHLFNGDCLSDATTLVIVEGWSDVITLDQWGIRAVTSTSGAASWKPEWTEAVGHIKRIYVAGDPDKAGARMAERLKRDIPWCRPLNLPGYDIRDLAAKKGWQQRDFLQLMRAADIKGSISLMTRRKNASN